MIYDLSQTINENLPVYPGDPHVKIEQAGQLEKDGYADRVLTIGTHNGTHMDAPAHMLVSGKNLKDFSVERFDVKAICIDVRNGFDAPKIAALLNEEHRAVIFYTGASKYFSEEKYWHEYTVPSPEVVGVLVNKKVPLVGIDTGSFDTAEDFPVHKALLGADILLIENLTNLTPLIGKTFELIALPLKLEIDGAPVRVIAKL